MTTLSPDLRSVVLREFSLRSTVLVWESVLIWSCLSLSEVGISVKTGKVFEISTI